MTDSDRNETDDGEESGRETRDGAVDADPTEGAGNRDETSGDRHDETGDENAISGTSEDTDSDDEPSEGADSRDESSEDTSTETSEGADGDESSDDTHGGTGDDTGVETGDDDHEETGDAERADREAAAGEAAAGEAAGDENGARDLSSAVAATGAASEEEAALRRARAVGRLLDEAVRVPGTDFRVGIDPILGILPGAGDAVAAGLSLYPIVEAYRMDAPGGTLAKMVALVAVDAVVGSIPIVGPLFDAVWKANVWNVRALERHLQAD